MKQTCVAGFHRLRVELSLAPACRHYSLLDKRKLQREFGDGIPGVVTSQLRQRVYDEERREAERKPPATQEKTRRNQ